MPFTVLKASKIEKDKIEVVAEFPEETDARQFVEEVQVKEPTAEFEYMIEAPPSKCD
jgi:hypothetical protein